MDSVKRSDIALKHGYCLNCLARTHRIRNCISPDNCLKCGLLHHTLLHPSRHPRISAPKSSVRDRLDMRNRVRKCKNFKQPSTKTPSTSKDKRKRKVAQQTDQRILSEAIRSLAAVLCLTSSS